MSFTAAPGCNFSVTPRALRGQRRRLPRAVAAPWRALAPVEPQRGGDARGMGPQHVRNKRLEVTQEKTGAIVSLPILPALAASIMATKTSGLVFLLSEHGKPYSRKGFGNKVRQWCDEAGLPQCSAHGLRKAAARRFAEAGCSNQQIKAWTGHTTDSEVSRYTAAADQQALSDSAGEMLMANLRKRLANEGDNTLEKEA